MIYQEYFQGIERSRLSLISGFLLEAAFLILSAWILSYRIGANAVWFAFPVTQGLMFIFYAIVVAHESRRLKIRGEGENIWNKLLLLPMTFDPINQLELFSEDDLTHHLGLRMTASISDELQYTSILRLNNLLIKI